MQSRVDAENNDEQDENHLLDVDLEQIEQSLYLKNLTWLIDQKMDALSEQTFLVDQDSLDMAAFLINMTQYPIKQRQRDRIEGFIIALLSYRKEQDLDEQEIDDDLYAQIVSLVEEYCRLNIARFSQEQFERFFDLLWAIVQDELFVDDDSKMYAVEALFQLAQVNDAFAIPFLQHFMSGVVRDLLHGNLRAETAILYVACVGQFSIMGRQVVNEQLINATLQFYLDYFSRHPRALLYRKLNIDLMLQQEWTVSDQLRSMLEGILNARHDTRARRFDFELSSARDVFSSSVVRIAGKVFHLSERTVSYLASSAEKKVIDALFDRREVFFPLFSEEAQYVDVASVFALLPDEDEVVLALLSMLAEQSSAHVNDIFAHLLGHDVSDAFTLSVLDRLAHLNVDYPLCLSDDVVERLIARIRDRSVPKAISLAATQCLLRFQRELSSAMDFVFEHIHAAESFSKKIEYFGMFRLARQQNAVGEMPDQRVPGNYNARIIECCHQLLDTDGVAGRTVATILSHFVSGFDHSVDDQRASFALLLEAYDRFYTVIEAFDEFNGGYDSVPDIFTPIVERFFKKLSLQAKVMLLVDILSCLQSDSYSKQYLGLSFLVVHFPVLADRYRHCLPSLFDDLLRAVGDLVKSESEPLADDTRRAMWSFALSTLCLMAPYYSGYESTIKEAIYDAIEQILWGLDPESFEYGGGEKGYVAEALASFISKTPNTRLRLDVVYSVLSAMLAKPMCNMDDVLIDAIADLCPKESVQGNVHRYLQIVQEYPVLYHDRGLACYALMRLVSAYFVRLETHEQVTLLSGLAQKIERRGENDFYFHVVSYLLPSLGGESDSILANADVENATHARVFLVNDEQGEPLYCLFLEYCLLTDRKNLTLFENVFRNVQYDATWLKIDQCSLADLSRHVGGIQAILHFARSQEHDAQLRFSSLFWSQGGDDLTAHFEANPTLSFLCELCSSTLVSNERVASWLDHSTMTMRQNLVGYAAPNQLAQLRMVFRRRGLSQQCQVQANLTSMQLLLYRAEPGSTTEALIKVLYAEYPPQNLPGIVFDAMDLGFSDTSVNLDAIIALLVYDEDRSEEHYDFQEDVDVELVVHHVELDSRLVWFLLGYAGEWQTKQLVELTNKLFYAVLSDQQNARGVHSAQFVLLHQLARRDHVVIDTLIMLLTKEFSGRYVGTEVSEENKESACGFFAQLLTSLISHSDYLDRLHGRFLENYRRGSEYLFIRWLAILSGLDALWNNDEVRYIHQLCRALDETRSAPTMGYLGLAGQGFIAKCHLLQLTGSPETQDAIQGFMRNIDAMNRHVADYARDRMLERHAEDVHYADRVALPEDARLAACFDELRAVSFQVSPLFALFFNRVIVQEIQQYLSDRDLAALVCASRQIRESLCRNLPSQRSETLRFGTFPRVSVAPYFTRNEFQAVNDVYLGWTYSVAKSQFRLFRENSEPCELSAELNIIESAYADEVRRRTELAIHPPDSQESEASSYSDCAEYSSDEYEEDESEESSYDSRSGYRS